MKKWLLVLFLILNMGAQTQVRFSTVPFETGGTNYTQDANCKGAWYMNCADNETDRSGESTDLTETSGDIPTSADVPSGYAGTSRDFELDDSEYLAIADGGVLDINGADQSVSFCMWVKFETWAASVRIGGKKATSQVQYYFGTTGAVPNVYFQFAVSADGTAEASAYNSGLSISTGTWYHLAGVYNDTDVRLYVNGELSSSANNPTAHTGGIFNGSAEFRIGATPTPSGYFDGLLDEVIVFNRALSAAEILDIYTNGISGNKGGSD